MNFNSIHFLFFFPVVTAVYFILPHRHRWLWLLAASYYFYIAWIPTYLSLIVISTIATYFTAIGMESDRPAFRRACLGLSLLTNFGILAVFKYYNFFISSLSPLTNHIGLSFPTLRLLLPIGISFHTFQAVSYSLEVYRGNVRAERHFGIFSLYSCFFPQLVAGPIERPYHLLPMFHKKFNFDYARVTAGLKLMAWGFFMKVVIADNLAVYVNRVFNDPRSFSGLPLVIASYFFAFQILCDFGGYTQIAIGAAKVMGFDLMENFERPYFAKSIPEFWRRWHISLSTWFRDYLYIPLGGNRVSTPRWMFNVMAVFLLCGLWHGADWKFVIWGGLHGAYMVASVAGKDFRLKAERAVGFSPDSMAVKAFRVFVTFNLVCLGWIFFRANSLGDAWYIIAHLFSASTPMLAGDNAPRFAFYLLLVFVLLAVHYTQRKITVRDYIIARPLPIRWAGYSFLVAAIFFLGRFEGSDFIYFRF